MLKLENEVYQEISSATSTVTLNNKVTLTAVTNPAIAYTVDNRKVSEVFRVNFLLSNTVAIPVGRILILQLPFYDRGFITDPNNIGCFINGNPMTCVAFDKVDWVKITIGTAINFGAGIENIIEIRNLQWPRYSKPNG